MANIYRLIIALCFSLIATASHSAVSPQWRAYYSSADNPDGWASSRAATASLWCSWAKARNILADWKSCIGTDYGYLTNSYGSQGVNDVEVLLSFESRCPPKSIQVGNECVCDNGAVQIGDSCTPPKDPLCGPLEGLPLGVSFMSTNMGAGSLSDYGGKVGNPGKGCFPGGCEVQGNMSSCGSAAGNITCVLDSPKFTGDKCDPQEQASEEKPKESKCEAGKCEASINGVKMCLPCGENIGKERGESKKTKVNPDGSRTETKTSTTTTTSKPIFNPSGPSGGGGDGGSGVPRTDGWKQGGQGDGKHWPIPSSKFGWDLNIPVETKRETTREKQINADGSSGGTKVTEKTTSSQVGADGRVRTAEETRTWYEDDAGNKTSETNNESHDEKDQDKKTYCQENPNSSQCKESSFAGACGADFRCDGDAIQCAIVREQHLRNCRLFDVKSVESELYETEKVKTGNRTEDLPNNETIDFNNRIKTDDLLGAGGGITDVNISVLGHNINLPFSNLNATLQYLGNVLVAVAMLIAAKIVGGK